MQDVTYCDDCKAYSYGGLCERCNGKNIITISSEEDGSFSINDDDELCVYFINKRDFTKKIRIFKELLDISSDSKKHTTGMSYVG